MPSSHDALPEPMPATFLGVLTSDGPSAASGPARVFTEMHAAAVELLRAYAARVISNEELASFLVRLVLKDATGGEWTIGAQTLSWYRRTPGLPWAAAPAPDASVTPVGSFPDLVHELRSSLAALEPGVARRPGDLRAARLGAAAGAAASSSEPGFAGASLPDQSVRAVPAEERSMDELLAQLRDVPAATAPGPGADPLHGGLTPSEPAGTVPPTQPLAGPFAGLPPRPGTARTAPAPDASEDDDALFQRLLGDDPLS